MKLLWVVASQQCLRFVRVGFDVIVVGYAANPTRTKMGCC